MASFTYMAKTSDGRTVTGTLEAASQAIVLQALRQKGLVVVVVRQIQGAGRPAFGSRVGLDDLAIFCRQMATLVDAGIPIVGGLDAVADQMENRRLQAVILEVRDAVESGTNFTAAVGRQSAVFSPLFVSMVRAGEASGHLAEVLDRLAIYLEKRASLQRKIRTACVYPGIVVTMALVITGILVLTVIPAFKEIFSTLGAQLPLPTRILVAVSDFARSFFLPILLLLGTGGFLLRRWIRRSARAQMGLDRMLLRLPLIGPIVRKVVIAKFSRTLATLTRSGVQILLALEIVSETAGNRVVTEAVLKVRTSIREGENIARPLAESGVFPPMVVRMISVGEQTGRLDEMLGKVATFYEEQVDAAVAGLTSAIEPIIIVVLGVVVGSIVMAIFLPIFKMSTLVGH